MINNTLIEWDSNFFGFKIEKAELGNCEIDELNNYTKSCFHNNIRLSYLFVNQDDNISKNSLLQSEINKVDTRTCFSRDIQLSDFELFNKNIKEYTETYVSDKLLKLSLRSGLYSRYYVDSNFSKNQFKALYTTWIKKSVSKELADKIYIYSDYSELQGFITVYVKENTGWIGLISVGENAGGKGIGTQLVESAILYSAQNHCNKIKVVTQRANMAACNLYKKSGFVIENQTDIYHLWHNLK